MERPGESDNDEYEGDGETEEFKGNVSVFIFQPSNKSCTGHLEFSVGNCIDEKFYRTFVLPEFVCVGRKISVGTDWGSGRGYPEFLSHQEIVGWETKVLNNGNLKIICKMTVKEEDKTTSKKEKCLEKVTEGQMTKLKIYYLRAFRTV